MQMNKIEFSVKDLNSSFEEIFKQSDRAVAIVSGSVLETILQLMLKKFLISDKHLEKLLFNGFAPLSTFRAKIDTAFYLGLLNEQEHHDLKIIKRIRNEFAHNIGAINFKSHKIADRCNELELLVSSSPPPPVLKQLDNPRVAFQMNVTMLASILFSKIEQINPLIKHAFNLHVKNSNV